MGVALVYGNSVLEAMFFLCVGILDSSNLFISSCFNGSGYVYFYDCLFQLCCFLW